ncbi:hypothetical protein Tco_0547652 [Tanacetum coccineum]
MQGLHRNIGGYAVILWGKEQRLLILITRWQKKMHFLLTTLKVVYVLTTMMLELMEDDTVEAIRRAKMLNRLRSYGILLNLSTWQRMLRVRGSFHLRIEESLRAQDSDKGKGTDNAKISRKRLKLDNHEHENGRAHKEQGECYQTSTKGQNEIDGMDIRFKLQGMQWHHETSLKAPIGPNPKRGMTRGLTTNTKEMDFVL